MTMKSKHVKAKDPTLADQYNDLVDDVNSLAKAQHETELKLRNQRKTATPFLAVVNNEASGGDGEYDEWDEVYRNDANDGWVVIPGGRTEATTGQSLYEFTGAEGFTSSAPVWVYPSRDSQGNRRYMFFANMPLCIYARLTSESSGEYAWTEMANDFSAEKVGGLTAATTGFNASVFGLTGLPVAAGVGEDSMKVIIFPRPPSLSTPETVWQAHPVIDKNGDFLSVNAGFGLQDKGAELPIVDALNETWNIEDQDAEDKEGARIAVIDTAGYTHATDEDTPGHIALGWSELKVDAGGRVLSYGEDILRTNTLADVNQCPAMSASQVMGAGGMMG